MADAVRCTKIAGVGAALVLASIPATPQAGLTRDEVLRLPAPLRAAASDFGAVECDNRPVVGLMPGEAIIAEVKLIEAEGMTVEVVATMHQVHCDDEPLGGARVAGAAEQ